MRYTTCWAATTGPIHKMSNKLSVTFLRQNTVNMDWNFYIPTNKTFLRQHQWRRIASFVCIYLDDPAAGLSCCDVGTITGTSNYGRDPERIGVLADPFLHLSNLNEKASAGRMEQLCLIETAACCHQHSNIWTNKVTKEGDQKTFKPGIQFSQGLSLDDEILEKSEGTWSSSLQMANTSCDELEVCSLVSSKPGQDGNWSWILDSYLCTKRFV